MNPGNAGLSALTVQINAGKICADDREKVMKIIIRALTLAMFVCVVACSSGSGERQEKTASCEQVKEFEDTYKKCIADAKKVG
jgi:hypothetical protein